MRLPSQKLKPSACTETGSAASAPLATTSTASRLTTQALPRARKVKTARPPTPICTPTRPALKERPAGPVGFDEERDPQGGKEQVAQPRREQRRQRPVVAQGPEQRD